MGDLFAGGGGNMYICIATAVSSRVSINYKPWYECSFYFENYSSGSPQPKQARANSDVAKCQASSWETWTETGSVYSVTSL